MARPLPAVLLAVLAAAPAAPARAEIPPGPPFDTASKSPHAVSLTVDTQPARDILVLLAAGDDSPAALRRLKASASTRAALKTESIAPEDYFGRLVLAASGTPDPLLQAYKDRAPYFRALLDEIDRTRPDLERIATARLASILPPSPAITARLVIVPFFGITGFSEVAPVHEADFFYFTAELPRLSGGEAEGTLQPREAFLKLLREVASTAWRTLFATYFRTAGLWPDENGNGFDALLAKTVAEGPPTLFLIPDEFFPLDPFFSEPVGRAFARWNAAAETLLDTKTKETARRDLFQEAARGDFWAHYPAIVGAQMADLLIREKGNAAYLRALAAGPRAVAMLYVETVKGTKHPDFSKAVKKALEKGK